MALRAAVVQAGYVIGSIGNALLLPLGGFGLIGLSGALLLLVGGTMTALWVEERPG